jgi:hypothetical protein
MTTMEPIQYAQVCADAATAERERIIALLAREDFPFALCLPTTEDGDWEPVMEPQIREALDPNFKHLIGK